MRGKVGLNLAGIAALIITPAYAGNSCGVLSTNAITKDHPRLCGEKSV